jgi:hypothetical protein
VYALARWVIIPLLLVLKVWMAFIKDCGVLIVLHYLASWRCLVPFKSLGSASLIDGEIAAA